MMIHSSFRSLFILFASLILSAGVLTQVASAQETKEILIHPMPGDDTGTNRVLERPRPRVCARYDARVDCDPNGGYQVTLFPSFPGGYVPDELDISSLTPGVSVSPNHFSPVPPNPVVTLTGATVGQTVTLLTNGAQIGAGDVKGSDLCCVGIIRVQIPRKTCKDSGKPDLAANKELVGRCTSTPGVAGHVCRIRVRITNVGTAPYFGPLNFTDTTSAPGASIFGETPPWNCVGASPTSCNRPPLTLNPGQSDTLEFSMNVPGYYQGGNIQECVKLTPIDGQGSVSLAQTLLNSLGYGAGPVDGQAGPQTRAAVRLCQAQNGQPQTGNYQDFLSFIGQNYSVDTNPQNDQACINIGLTPLPKKCPRGTVGQWPNCRKIEIKRCPQGTTGQWPNCRKIEVKNCPQGTIGKWPNCIQIPRCPTGTFGNWPNCKKKVIIRHCPKGTTGRWPNCVGILK